MPRVSRSRFRFGPLFLYMRQDRGGSDVIRESFVLHDRFDVGPIERLDKKSFLGAFLVFFRCIVIEQNLLYSHQLGLFLIFAP